MRLDELTSSGPVALIDAGVTRDVAIALTGLWQPDAEPDAGRRAAIVDAARLRLYGDRDRSGWTLLVTRAGAERALARGDADWSVGMLPVAEELDDAPPPADVESLVALYRKEEGIDAEAAEALALAVLWHPITVLVSRLPRGFRHAREGDLPPRLAILDVHEAVERLEIQPGEQPLVSVPAGSMLDGADRWWIPA